MPTKFVIEYGMLKGYIEKEGVVTFTVEKPTASFNLRQLTFTVEKPTVSLNLRQTEKLAQLRKLCLIYDTVMEVRGTNYCTSIPLEGWRIENDINEIQN